MMLAASASPAETPRITVLRTTGRNALVRCAFNERKDLVLDVKDANEDAYFIAKNTISSRTAQAEQSAKLKADAYYKAEQSRIESDLKHAKERNDELMSQLEAARLDTKNQLMALKDELNKRSSDEIALREKAHKEAMDSLQLRFDETMAKVTAQVKSDTADMLKAHQKEFSESSNISIGQIVNPLKQNIVALIKKTEFCSH
jgi:hypothetical protein